MTSKTLMALGLLACAALGAQAHVVLDQPSAAAGSYFKANFRVGHGCGTSATRQIVVNIPVGVQGAKPMRKPGWSLEIVREPIAKPYMDHGRQVTEEVARITWTARTAADMLPNEQFDEFALQVKLPATPGTLYWKVNQLCEQGRNDWVDVPQPGQPAKGLKSPAAVLTLTGGPTEGGDAVNITAVLKGMFDKPEAPLVVLPPTVDGDYAVVGWLQQGRGGRALLRREAGAWSIIACAGAGFSQADGLAQSGMPKDVAMRIAANLKAAEARLAPEQVKLMDSFGPAVAMGGAADPHAGHKH